MNLLKAGAVLMSVTVLILVNGCQHKPTTSPGAKIEERGVGGAGAAGAGAGSTPVEVVAPVGTAGTEAKGVVDPNVVVGQEVAQPVLTPAQEADLPRELRVRFAYDSADLDQASLDILKAHAEYMRKHPALKLRIEGHCDERGTPEYNLALGEQRAKAVRGVLLVNGINFSRMELVSFGEERPLNPGHDESAWAENRRAELVYIGK